jgi:hypothetical protein
VEGTTIGLEVIDEDDAASHAAEQQHFTLSSETATVKGEREKNWSG